VLYGVAYGLSFPRILRLIVSMVLVDFVLMGIVVSTLAWYEASRPLLRDCFRLGQLLMIHSIAGTEAPFQLRQALLQPVPARSDGALGGAKG